MCNSCLLQINLVVAGLNCGGLFALDEGAATLSAVHRGDLNELDRTRCEEVHELAHQIIMN